MAIGAEEDLPQNGKEEETVVGNTAEYIFVDGTTEGIEALTKTLGDCSVAAGSPVVCTSDGVVNRITLTGALES